MDALRLEREVVMTEPRTPSLAQRYAMKFGRWMITTGERLNRRIHDPIPVPRWYQSFKIAR